MILCDTDILIEFFKKNETIVGTLREIGQHRLAVSHVTVAELYFGALNKAELARIRRDLATLHAYSVSVGISQRFLGLMETYSLSHKLSLPDALIAATALEHDLTLFTLNWRDFRFIAGLQIYRA